MALHRQHKDVLNRAAAPELGKPEVSYPTPNKADLVVIERVPIGAGKYEVLPYHSPHPDYDQNGLFLVWQGKVKAENNQVVAMRVYANDTVSNEDWYNAAIKYGGDVTTYPVYVRSYIELREDYDPETPGARLKKIMRLRVLNEGAGYTSVPTVSITGGGAGAGATAKAIMNPSGTKVIALELLTAGANYDTTTAIIVSITGGGGAGATASATIQGSDVYMVKEETSKLDSEDQKMASLFIKVHRIYERLPGPYIPYSRWDDNLGPITGKWRAVLTTAPQQLATSSATTKIIYEARDDSAVVAIERNEAWGDDDYDHEFEKEIPDRVPTEFQDIVPTRTSGQTEVGIAAEPTLGPGELRRTSKEVNKFWRHQTVTDRDLTRLPITKYDYDIDGVRADGALHDGVCSIAKTLTADPSGLPVETGFLTLESEVKDIGAGLTLRRTKKLFEATDASLLLTARGSGFEEAPIVVFSPITGGSGEGAAGTAILSNTPTPPGGEVGGTFDLQLDDFGDENGLFFFLAARYNNGIWRNPATAGTIGIQVVSDPNHPTSQASLANLVDRAGSPRVQVIPISQGGGHQIIFNLGAGRSFNPTKIAIRQTTNLTDANRQHNLKVQASNDNGATWTDLHPGNIPIPQTAGEWSDGALDNATGWNALRIFGTDDNIPGYDYLWPALVLGEIEFYGQLTIVPGVDLFHSFDGDAHGVFNYLGELGNGGTWRNPQTFGDIAVTADSLGGGSGTVDEIVDRQPSNVYQDATVGRSFTFDLLATRRLACTGLSVRQRTGSNATLTFNLQAKVAMADTWTNLASVVEDSVSEEWHTVEVADETPYRYFRIISAAGNFAVGEVELYGQLTFPPLSFPGETFSVASVTVDNQGQNYAVAPIVSFAGDGTGAAGTAVLDGTGHVIRVNMTNHGYGYTAVTVDFVTVGDSGSGADVTSIINGALTGIEVGDPGSGYDDAPDVIIDGGPGGVGLNGAATAVLGFPLAAINVTNQGAGNYTSAPGVNISPNPEGASAQSFLSKRLASIGVSDNGHDYATTPTVNIDAPTGANPIQATAHAVMGTGGGGLVETLTYGSDGDNADVFDFIGRDYGRRPWANPSPSRVTIVTTTGFGASEDLLLDHAVSEFALASMFEPWIQFDLGAGNSLVCNKGSYRQRTSGPGSNTDSFDLQGSNNGSSWTTLSSETGVSTTPDAWHSFDVTPTVGYRYFRLIRTGVTDFFTIGEFALYGDVTVNNLAIDVLPYSSDGDNSGALNRIGTVFGTEAWQNPNTISGTGVTVSVVPLRPGDNFDDPDLVCDQMAGNCSTNGDAGTSNEYIKVDLGAGRALLANKFSYRYRNDTTTYAPTAWKWEGSNDDSTWYELANVTGQTPSTAGGGAWVSSNAATMTTAYRYFRVRGIGVNSSGGDHMSIGEMELYGSLFHGTTGIGADEVESIVIDNPGFGYLVTPAVTLTGGGGADAAATATREATGYIDHVQIIDPGLFETIPAVSLTGGGGSGAVITRSLETTGSIIRIDVDVVGSNYQGAPGITFDTNGGPGSGAAADASIEGPVSGFTVVDGGTGYVSVPLVQIQGNATATANIAGGAVVSLNLTFAGTGYSTPPTVVVSAPGGPEGVATLGFGIDNIAVNSAGSVNGDFPFGKYRIPPTVIIEGDGRSASAYSVLGRSLLRVEVINSGDNYGPTTTGGISSDTGSGAAITVQRKFGIASTTVSAGGSGYTSDPAVSAPSPEGTDAILQAIRGLPLLQATMLNGGSNYTSAPTVVIPAPFGGGTNAVGTAILGFGVDAVTMDNMGTGYVSTPNVELRSSDGTGSGATAVAELLGKTLSAITVDIGGTGYVTAPTIVVGDGSVATAHATVLAGVITGIIIDTDLGGWTAPPTIFISGDTGGSGAHAFATLSAGQDMRIVVTNPGSGYEAAPNVLITLGGGSGAAATAALLAAGSVKRVELSNFGTKYITDVGITFTGGGGTGASASGVRNVAAAGPVVIVSVLAQGAGYFAATVTCVFSGGGGSGAAATATKKTLGQIRSVTVTLNGSGFEAPPIIRIGEASMSDIGAGAVCRAILTTHGLVNRVVVATAGEGFTAPPVIRFGDNGGASATANLEDEGSIETLTLTVPGGPFTIAPLVSFSPPGDSPIATALYILPLAWVPLFDEITDPTDKLIVQVRKDIVTPRTPLPPGFSEVRALNHYRSVQIVSKIDLSRLPPAQEILTTQHVAFPDLLIDVIPVWSLQRTHSQKLSGNHYQGSVTAVADISGTILVLKKGGFRGAAFSRVIETFHFGIPPENTDLKPTIIRPVSGTAYIRGGGNTESRSGVANGPLNLSGNPAQIGDIIGFNAEGQPIVFEGFNTPGPETSSTSSLSATNQIVDIHDVLTTGLQHSSFNEVSQDATASPFLSVHAEIEGEFRVNIPASCPDSLPEHYQILAEIGVAKRRLGMYVQTLVFVYAPGECSAVGEYGPPDEGGGT